jgi:hypothetical protein
MIRAIFINTLGLALNKPKINLHMRTCTACLVDEITAIAGRGLNFLLD